MALKGKIEFVPASEFNGEVIPAKFVLETSDSRFSIAAARCNNKADVMVDMLDSGKFTKSINRETGEAYKTKLGKTVYSVPFEDGREDTGVEYTPKSITVSDAVEAVDNYADVKITIKKRAVK